MIKTNDDRFPVNMMCRMLSVSRSGYYAWKHRPHSDRSQANKLLADDIKRIFDEEKECSGSPRITKLLQEEGKSVGRHRVARIMRNNNWRAKAAKNIKPQRIVIILYLLRLTY